MFSLNKLLVLALLVAVAWYGLRWFQNYQKLAEARAAEAERRRRTLPAEDLTKCRACGTYVAVGASDPCRRPDCPLPRLRHS